MALAGAVIALFVGVRGVGASGVTVSYGTASTAVAGLASTTMVTKTNALPTPPYDAGTMLVATDAGTLSPQYSRWRTILDCDLTAEGNQTFNIADTVQTAVTLCGLTAHTIVTASTVTGGISTWAVQNGTGLVIAPGAGNVNNKSLGVRIGFANWGLSGATVSTRLSVYLTTADESLTASGQIGFEPRIGVHNIGGTAGGLYFQRITNTVDTTTLLTNQFAATSAANTAITITLASWDVYVLEWQGSTARSYRGLYSSGWPADTALVYDGSVLQGSNIILAGPLDDPAAGGVEFARTTNTSALTPTHTYKRVRIEIGG